MAFGPLSGVVIGYCLSMLKDWFNDNKKAKKEREQRLQQLLFAVESFNIWKTMISDYYLFGENDIRNNSPIAEIESIVAIYFPELIKSIKEVSSALNKYILQCTIERISIKQDASYRISSVHNERYAELGDAIKKLKDKIYLISINTNQETKLQTIANWFDKHIRNNYQTR